MAPKIGVGVGNAFTSGGISGYVTREGIKALTAHPSERIQPVHALLFSELEPGRAEGDCDAVRGETGGDSLDDFERF